MTCRGLANMTRRALIHDSASGPDDLSGPRLIFPIRLGAFHEPGYVSASVRLCASVHPRVFVTGGYQERERCVGIVEDRSDIELCTYG
jgi:hypothetical protein